MQEIFVWIRGAVSPNAAHFLDTTCKERAAGGRAAGGRWYAQTVVKKEVMFVGKIKQRRRESA